MSGKTYRPRFRRAHAHWGYVAHGIDNGLHFVAGDPGHPAPYWSNGEMRVRLDYNDYRELVWIVEAKVAEGQTIPADCRMVAA